MRFTNPFAGLFNRSGSAPTRHATDTDRLQQYRRYMRAYQGISLRAPLNAYTPTSEHRLRFNLNAPIVNLGAAFLAGKPLTWKVGRDANATEAAKRIWDRSGGDRTFMEAARTLAVYGDMVALATADDQGRSKIEFVSPDICFPLFDGSDSSRLRELQIAWQEEDSFGRAINRMEIYNDAGRHVYLNGEEVKDDRQDMEFIPASWLRNLSIKGFPFGWSDLAFGVADLVEEYDHIAGKQTRIIDYYSAPNIVFPGMSASDIQKNVGTFFFTPDKDSKPYMLEWQGNQPNVKEQLDRIIATLERVSQTPEIAFGNTLGGASESGIAKRLRFGPLIAKCNDKWAGIAPRLEYLMWLCLRQEDVAADLDDVTVLRPDPVPVDETELLNAAKTAIDAGLRSRNSAMSQTGVEDPAAEQRAITKEERLDRLETLLEAGVPLPGAVELAGFTGAERERLLRSDWMDEDTEALENEARNGAGGGDAAAGAPREGADGGADRATGGRDARGR